MLSTGMLAMEIRDKDVWLAYGAGLLRRKISRCHTYDAEIADGFIESGALKIIMDDFIGRGRSGGKKIVMTTKTSRSIMKRAWFPPMSARNIENAADYNKARVIPVDTGKYVIDYKAVTPCTGRSSVGAALRLAPLHRTRESAGTEIIYMGLPLDMAEYYAETLEGLGLLPVGIDLYENCVAKYFAQGCENIFFTYGRKLSFMRVSNGCVDLFHDFSYDGCHEEMDGYFKYRDIALESACLLDVPSGLASYFEKREIPFRFADTGQGILEILLKGCYR